MFTVAENGLRLSRKKQTYNPLTPDFFSSVSNAPKDKGRPGVATPFVVVPVAVSSM